MSASFPQMAFWVIFPLAALIVLSGWVMIIISAIKKLRSPANAPGQAGKQKVGNVLPTRFSSEDLALVQPDSTTADLIASGGSSPAAPLP